MRFTEVAADAFSKIALNAGVILSDFNPAEPDDKETMKTKIIGATSGGNAFTAVPTFSDFGEDIDNVPTNTLELKKLDSVEVTLSGTMVTTDAATVKRLIGPADVETTGTLSKITPRKDVYRTDYQDIWWVGDYSDYNGAEKGGFIAIHVKRAMNTGGFALQSTDNGKSTFAYSFVGHYTMTDVSDIPFEVYVKQGEAETATSGGETGAETGGGATGETANGSTEG